MKTLVVAGSASSIGKSTLCEKIRGAFPALRAAIIKVGHGPVKSASAVRLFHSPEEAIAFVRSPATSAMHDLLIIESSQILFHLTPDLAIFLHSPDRPFKPWSEEAQRHCHITIGPNFSATEAREQVQRVFGTDPLSLIFLETTQFLTEGAPHA